MKKIVFVCGAIAGIIPITWCIFSLQLYKGHMSMNERLFWGYATMVLGFSLIYVGVKSYRDNQNGGVISFGKALKVALLITLVASTVYVAVWLVDFYVFVPDYMDKYAAAALSELKAKHASQAVIDKQMAQVAEAAKMIRNPILNALITYTEIVPPGILISLIVSAILKRKEVKAVPA